MKTLRTRLLSKTAINWETGCWEWTATTNHGGYGTVRVGERQKFAHRVAYELLVGPIPAGLQIDHLCRVRHCINPAHLEPVTPRKNVLRSAGLGAINAAKTHCPAGHEYSDENTLVTRGARNCRTCLRARNREYRAKNVERERARSRADYARRRAAAGGAS